MSYSIFAKYYDVLTKNIDYQQRAEYFNQIFLRYGRGTTTILDLACGTGSLSFPLSQLGYRITATDSSAEMLAVASTKDTTDTNVLFLHQSMQQLALPYKVDGAVCALDSLNHLPSIIDLVAVFRRLSLFLKPDAILVFDVNSLYKHKEILADNCFVYETDNVFCSWQNQYNYKDHSVDILLDFFQLQAGGNYLRESEDFTEQYFSKNVITRALEKTGFKVLDIFGDDTFKAPKETEQRLVYVAKLNELPVEFIDYFKESLKRALKYGRLSPSVNFRKHHQNNN